MAGWPWMHYFFFPPFFFSIATTTTDPMTGPSLTTNERHPFRNQIETFCPNNDNSYKQKQKKQKQKKQKRTNQYIIMPKNKNRSAPKKTETFPPVKGWERALPKPVTINGNTYTHSHGESALSRGRGKVYVCKKYPDHVFCVTDRRVRRYNGRNG